MGKDEAEAYKKAGNINSKQNISFQKNILAFYDEVNI